MNAQGIEVERTLGKPILSGLHGLWSVGLGAGAAGAALAAAVGLDPLPHFAIVAAVLALASVVFLRDLLPEREQVRAELSGEEERVPLHWTLPLALLGVIAFCSFVGEGSASDWSAGLHDAGAGHVAGPRRTGVHRVRGDHGEHAVHGRLAPRAARRRDAGANRLAGSRRPAWDSAC